MTSAATPAVMGADWLVPPKASMSESPPLKFVHPTNRPELSHTAQSASPGALRSMVRPFWVMPAEDSEEMLLLSQLPLPNLVARAYSVCSYSRESVVAPAEISS